MKKEALYTPIREKYTQHIGKPDVGADTVYGTRGMGYADIGGRRRNDGFPFRMAVGILGKIDERRHDFNAYDKPPYDALTALSE